MRISESGPHDLQKKTSPLLEKRIYNLHLGESEKLQTNFWQLWNAHLNLIQDLFNHAGEIQRCFLDGICGISNFCFQTLNFLCCLTFFPRSQTVTEVVPSSKATRKGMEKDWVGMVKWSWYRKGNGRKNLVNKTEKTSEKIRDKPWVWKRSPFEKYLSLSRAPSPKKTSTFQHYNMFTTQRFPSSCLISLAEMRWRVEFAPVRLPSGRMLPWPLKVRIPPLKYLQANSWKT